jgi:hypothetical protein
MPTRNWAGPFLFALGAWFLATALQRRQRALAAQLQAQARGLPIDVYPSQKFALAWAVARPLVQATLLATGLVFVAFFVQMGDAGPFAVVDLAGFLFMLAAYGVWFSIRTRYRAVVPVAADG